MSFYVNYIHVLATTGGESHRTFRTSTREPKAAALDWIRERSAGRPDCAETRIVAEDWWAYWPLRYLAYREPKLDRGHDERRDGRAVHAQHGRVQLSGRLRRRTISRASSHRRNIPPGREAVNDPLNRPILLILSNR